MALAKLAVTSLLMHWSYYSVALIHYYNAFDLNGSSYSADTCNTFMLKDSQ